MSATPTATPPVEGPTPSLAVAGQVAARNLMLISRVPSTFIPSLIFPVMIVVIFAGVFSAVARLPGFPAKSMLDWLLPMAIMQGAAFAGVATGIGVARELQIGFFDRFLLAPVRPSALVAGSLVASVVRSLVPTVLVLLTGLVAGAHLEGGVLGVVTLLVAAMGVGLCAAGYGVGLALRLGTVAKAVPLMQVGIFISFFLSTAQMPLDAITGWLHGVARVNPMTNVLALGRQGFIGDVTWAESWPGLLALVIGGLLLTAFAVRGLSRVSP